MQSRLVLFSAAVPNRICAQRGERRSEADVGCFAFICFLIDYWRQNSPREGRGESHTGNAESSATAVI